MQESSRYRIICLFIDYLVSYNLSVKISSLQQNNPIYIFSPLMSLKVKSSAPFEQFNTHCCRFTRAFSKKIVCSYFVMFFLSSSCSVSQCGTYIQRSYMSLDHLVCPDQLQ